MVMDHGNAWIYEGNLYKYVRGFLVPRSLYWTATSGFMNPKLTKTCSTGRLTVSPQQKLNVAVWHFASITEDACKYQYILGCYYYHYHYIHITTYHYILLHITTYYAIIISMLSPFGAFLALKPHENHLSAISCDLWMMIWRESIKNSLPGL